MRTVVASLVLLVGQVAWAQEPINVVMNVTSADAVTATQVRRRLNDALSELQDVVVTDFSGDFTVNVVVLKLELSSQIKVGYSLSVVITEPFPPDDVQTLVEPDMQDYAAMLMEGAVNIRHHYIEVVNGERFESAVGEVAKQLDLRVLQDFREKRD